MSYSKKVKKVSIPKCTPEGVVEDRYNIVPVCSQTYLTREAEQDAAYMAAFKERAAVEAIRSIANWLEEHPEAVEVHAEYDLSRNATRFETVVRFMVKEK